MIIKTTVKAEGVLNDALKAVNEKYEGNITFKKCEIINGEGTRARFTLTVKDSRKAGGRISHSGRRVCAACWHVHGDFFLACLALDAGAVIKSAGCADITAGYTRADWQDRNIGSQFSPMMYSEACDCER
jgi:hypothetical protein